MWLMLSPLAPIVPKNSMAPMTMTKTRMETVTGSGNTQIWRWGITTAAASRIP